MSRRLLVLLLAPALLLVLSAGVAQADDPYRIVLSSVDAADFPTVRIVGTVVDAAGDPVPDLRADDVEVRERGIRQPASARLTSQTPPPIALALVIDTSGSMAGRPLADAKTAIAAMISELRAQDEVAIIAFNATARLVQPLTADKASVHAAIDSLVANGNTAIYDAALAGADVLDAADPKMRRAIVLLTDGVDTASRTAPDAAVARLATSGHPVYAIGLGSNLNESTLESLAGASSGGVFFSAPTSAQLGGIYGTVSRQLLTEFSVTYPSSVTGAREGSKIQFEVSLLRSGVVVARAIGMFEVPPGRGARQEPVLTARPAAAVPTATAVGNDTDRTWVVSLLGAATALTLVLWVHDLTLYLGAGPRRRLKMYLSDVKVVSDESTPPRQLVTNLVAPLRSLGRAMLRFLPTAYIAGTRHRLELAGEPLTLTEFIGLRWASTAGVAVLVAAVVFALSQDGSGTLMGALFGVLIGFMLPGVVIGFIARRRAKAIQRALVPSLDMLALSTEAGLAFDGAISQVVTRWRNPFSDELRRLLLEFQMGRDRKEALRELARRTGLQDVARFVNAVIQADTLGVGLAKVLQDQAVELRTKRRQRAEEQARIAPIKMMFPMVLLIFPALFVVILGPAVPRLLAIFEVAR